MTDTMSTVSAEVALSCALDKVEQCLRDYGWPDDEAEWSLTVGRHVVFACVEEVRQGEGRIDVRLGATTGFLPWKRRQQERNIALSA